MVRGGLLIQAAPARHLLGKETRNEKEKQALVLEQTLPSSGELPEASWETEDETKVNEPELQREAGQKSKIIMSMMCGSSGPVTLEDGCIPVLTLCETPQNPYDKFLLFY